MYKICNTRVYKTYNTQDIQHTSVQEDLKGWLGRTLTSPSPYLTPHDEETGGPGPGLQAFIQN